MKRGLQGTLQGGLQHARGGEGALAGGAPGLEGKHALESQVRESEGEEELTFCALQHLD